MNCLITGGCLCGKVRFCYEGEIGPSGYCHCADCRKIAGGAFIVSARLEKGRFRITEGAPKAYTKNADSGNEISRWFCPDCGAPLYTTSPVHPEFLYVKAGALDDPEIVTPSVEKWTASKISWAEIPKGIKRQEE